MKTEQEQIEKMMLDVPQTIVAYDANPKGQHLYGEQRLQIAEILYDKGYGKVSEYKAEIERLKEVIEVFKNDTECNLNHITVENGQLKAKNKVLKDGIVKAFTNGFNEGRKQVEKDIRRAQIDVLNKLKEKYGFYSCYAWGSVVKSLSEIIDELIKEVENDK